MTKRKADKFFISSLFILTNIKELPSFLLEPINIVSFRSWLADFCFGKRLNSILTDDILD